MMHALLGGMKTQMRLKAVSSTPLDVLPYEPFDPRPQERFRDLAAAPCFKDGCADFWLPVEVVDHGAPAYRKHATLLHMLPW